MKIKIRSSDGKGFSIAVPFRVAMWFISRKNGDKSAEEISREDLKKLAEAVKQAKKVWGHLTIVEVKEKDGDEVTITL